MEADEVRERIDTRVTLGHFMANMLRAADSEKASGQPSFANHLCAPATLLDGFLRNNDQIREIDYALSDF